MTASVVAGLSATCALAEDGPPSDCQRSAKIDVIAFSDSAEVRIRVRNADNNMENFFRKAPQSGPPTTARDLHLQHSLARVLDAAAGGPQESDQGVCISPLDKYADSGYVLKAHQESTLPFMSERQIQIDSESMMARLHRHDFADAMARSYLRISHYLSSGFDEDIRKQESILNSNATDAEKDAALIELNRSIRQRGSETAQDFRPFYPKLDADFASDCKKTELFSAVDNNGARFYIGGLSFHLAPNIDSLMAREALLVAARKNIPVCMKTQVDSDATFTIKAFAVKVSSRKVSR